jgi:hypothetical protein
LDLELSLYNNFILMNNKTKNIKASNLFLSIKKTSEYSFSTKAVLDSMYPICWSETIKL